MSHAARNTATAQQFFDRMFNKGDATAVSMLAPGYLYNGQPQSNPSLIAWVNGMRANLPNLHFIFEDILAADDKVALRWRMTGTTAAGVQVQTTGTNILTFNKDGLCVSNYQNGYAQYTIGGKTVTNTDLLIYNPPHA